MPPRDPNDHTIYIGKKLAMSYVLAVVTRFNNGDNEVKVKARGRNISVAVDVTQIAKNRFIPTLKIKNVEITTEELTSDDGRMSRVSSMEITMNK
ncbi:MAG: DNA-binding protein Alba [Candidatus Micrarchaeota archaeon]|nr:DNA-binding protein Alba [Candidatus Micrarchaeota archaeon]